MLYALLADTYDSMVTALETGDDSLLRTKTKRAVQLNRGAGALLAFGIDFEPTAKIYEGVIRPAMPEGFSGYWLREAVALSQSRQRWTSIKSTRPLAEQAKKEDEAARNAYHGYHRLVMRRSVEDARSLANIYKHQNGVAHEVTAREFDQYDAWFSIDRACISRMDFASTACWVVRLVAGSISSGSRLDDATLRDLRAGLEAALCAVAESFGPVAESSLYYPKSARGE